MQIAGAGLAGLLAAHAWPTAQVFESEPEPRAIHKALLRFRSDAVANLTGIEFRPVTVRKGIWFEEKFVQPNIQLANWYAAKVTGFFSGDRSIWAQDPVQRWIAPENFYESLIDAVGSRIHWNEPFIFLLRKPDSEPVVSTVPLPVALCAHEHFRRAGITVARFRIEGAELFQTIYFPAPGLNVYRASITGSLLIVESVAANCKGNAADDLHTVLEAFGISPHAAIPIGISNQSYGKIVPLPAHERRALLHRLTTERAIFSLGRFATWRNILLDDVVQDIAVIRRLLKASAYELNAFKAK